MNIKGTVGVYSAVLYICKKVSDRSILKIQQKCYTTKIYEVEIRDFPV